MTFSAALLAVAFYGINFNPASTNAPTESRIYPVSPVAYRMVQPDGRARLFEVTDVEKGILSGERPWLGVAKSGRIDVWADPEATGGKLRTAFTFVGGRLRLMVLDGKKYTFPNAKSLKDDLNTLFPERKKRTYAKNSAADIWQGGGRLRLWFANPNSAGILLAEVSLLLIWLILLRRNRFVRVGAGAGLAAAAYGLFISGSRGALVGFVIGTLLIAASYGRKLMTKRGLLIVLAAAGLLCAGVAAGGHAARVIDMFHNIDVSNMTRLKVAKAAVAMFADAPFGWQGGEVPGREACLNWYVFDELRSLRTHIMSLAECGWFKGFFYLVFWFMTLAIGMASLKKGRSLAAALWAAFGLAGCFNPIYKEWEIWVLPLASFALLFDPHGRLSVRTWGCSGAVASGCSVACIVALVFAGKAMPPKRPANIPVKSCGAAAYVNGDNPRIWVVGDPVVMAGSGFPGREILAFYAQNPAAEALAYVHSVKDLPQEADCVLVAGRNVPDYLAEFAEGRACKAKRLVFLSPSVGPDAVPEKLRETSQVMWFAGNLLAFHNPAYAEKRPWVKLMPGCERYLPNWLQLVLAK